jgi:NAD-dependent deacetylase
MDDDVTAVAEAMTAADRVTVLTGAGVSTASGIPSFRGEDGVWNTAFDPADFRIDRFRNDPAGFWADRLDLYEYMYADDVTPNAAHTALARLEELGVVDGVVTQNTDGLHAAAGTTRLVELHGNASRAVCTQCDETLPTDRAFESVREGATPHCPDCGGVLKPDVVLFGEQLPHSTYHEARRMARDSDLFLAVGSSLTVEPAASLPVEAAERGELAVVNLEPTEKDHHAHYLLRGDATEVLPALVDEVETHSGPERPA